MAKIIGAIATSHTNHLLAAGTPVPDAFTSGFHRALLAGSIFVLAAALIGLRTSNTRGETQQSVPEAEPQLEPAGAA